MRFRLTRRNRRFGIKLLPEEVVMIRLKCPACNVRIDAPDEAVGTRISCLKCGAQIDVFIGHPSPPDTPDADVTDEHSESGRKKLQIGLIVAGAVAVIVTLILVVAFAVVPDADGKNTGARKASPTQPAKPTDARDGHTKIEEDQVAENIKSTIFGGIAIGVGILILLAMLAYFTLVVGVAIWVAKDANNRGHEGALWAMFYSVPQMLWFGFPILLLIPVIGWPLMPVAVALSWLGFIVYILARRPGSLRACDTCGNKRLVYVKCCPHCGHTK
jgi:hypothetical protein